MNGLLGIDVEIVNSAAAIADGKVRHLRDLRRRLKLGQEQVGRVIGVHRNTLHRWECGECFPDIAQHLAWKKVLLKEAELDRMAINARKAA